jgi:hypothetical protein
MTDIQKGDVVRITEIHREDIEPGCHVGDDVIVQRAYRAAEGWGGVDWVQIEHARGCAVCKAVLVRRAGEAETKFYGTMPSGPLPRELPAGTRWTYPCGAFESLDPMFLGADGNYRTERHRVLRSGAVIENQWGDKLRGGGVARNAEPSEIDWSTVPTQPAPAPIAWSPRPGDRVRFLADQRTSREFHGLTGTVVEGSESSMAGVVWVRLDNSPNSSGDTWNTFADRLELCGRLTAPAHRVQRDEPKKPDPYAEHRAWLEDRHGGERGVMATTFARDLERRRANHRAGILSDLDGTSLDRPVTRGRHDWDPLDAEEIYVS